MFHYCTHVSICLGLLCHSSSIGCQQDLLRNLRGILGAGSNQRMVTVHASTVIHCGPLREPESAMGHILLISENIMWADIGGRLDNCNQLRQPPAPVAVFLDLSHVLDVFLELVLADAASRLKTLLATNNCTKRMHNK